MLTHRDNTHVPNVDVNVKIIMQATKLEVDMIMELLPIMLKMVSLMLPLLKGKTFLRSQSTIEPTRSKKYVVEVVEPLNEYENVYGRKMYKKSLRKAAFHQP
ncbi:hypothetical protein ACFE04_005158 [Oxalis oulophora]